jgi:hypothetical protein
MAIGPGLPFVLAGGLKVVYDLALYVTFRRVRLSDDETSTRLPTAPTR